MKASVLLLLTGGLVFWALASCLAYFLWEGQRDVWLGYSATAAGLCLVPSTLTLLWALWGAGQPSEEQRLIVLGGTGIRMFFVLGAGLALTSTIPYFQQQSFWLWILVFYLFTLALEMVIVVRRLSPSAHEGEGERGSSTS